MPWMKDGTLDEVYNGIEMQALRDAFDRGAQPAECQWCWDEEAAGIKSFREKYNELSYSYTNNPSPQIVDLKLSNVCTLKCRMCGPTASSAIAKEQNKVDKYFLSDKIIGTENQAVFFESWLPGMKQLELTGGEPFFSNENRELLHGIANSGHAKHIDLLITTNGMFYAPKLLDRMRAFKSVKLAISVDDLGPRLEYARTGASWDIIKTNILALIKDYPEFEVSMYRTINIFNIFYLDELDLFGANHVIPVNSGLLHEPPHLNIQNMPYWAKEEVMDKYGDNEAYSAILDFMNKPTNGDLTRFRSETKHLDSIRRTSFVSTYPEWSEILIYE